MPILVMVTVLIFCHCSSKPRYLTYAPKTVQPYQVGVASYYANKFHGQKTASGNIFDMYKLSAAHKNLPLGTMVRITNLENGKSVVVEINDRGPYKKGRIIDLSYEAARRIGMVEQGTAKVEIRIVE